MSGSDYHSQIFRNASPADHVTDEDIHRLIRTGELTVHAPGSDLPAIRSPEDYEAEEWDSGRESPKTLGEAGDALRQRRLHGGADKDADPYAYDKLADE